MKFLSFCNRPPTDHSRVSSKWTLPFKRCFYTVDWHACEWTFDKYFFNKAQLLKNTRMKRINHYLFFPVTNKNLFICLDRQADTGKYRTLFSNELKISSSDYNSYASNKILK